MKCGELFDKDPKSRDTDNAIWRYFFDREENSDINVVITKVVLINSLYSTQIYDPFSIARFIVAHHAEIDKKISESDQQVVEIIKNANPDRNTYSFATKFCAFHNPLAFPIYDNRVADLLLEMISQYKWDLGDIRKKSHLEDYASFKKLVDHCIAEFRVPFNMFGRYKALDKGLWFCAKFLKAYNTQKKWEEFCGDNHTTTEEWLKNHPADKEETKKVKKFRLTTPQIEILDKIAALPK